MSIKHRLMLMNFLQFFIWGAWLISLGGYMIVTLKFTGGQVGSIYATMGIASLFMPGILGIVADRWINAEKVLAMCHMIGAVLLVWAANVQDPNVMFWVMLLNAMVYMPTIALNNTVSYVVLEQKGFNIVKDFPPIRVWGTIGFICAMWLIDIFKITVSPQQLYISAGAAFLLGLYAFTMPQCPPAKVQKNKSLVSSLGLDAFVLFKDSKMAVFFIFAMLIGAALQVTNTFGQAFLYDFTAEYESYFAVKHPSLLMSVSQISETLFILAIPFFLHRFGIKKVMIISIWAWVLRFALFGLGNPGSGLILLILSMIIYGMAFDFFNISGSLFVEQEADPTMRASAQGLFMIMTNGVGAFLGGMLSGWVVDFYTADGVKDWQSIWFVFAAYALVLAIIFPIAFRYKHKPLQAVQH
ncbi:MAG TPA: MFS transporter [Bacteroidales bacterium]|nr:MFS transporter [Bacteroidales bacterium]